ncbi:hypothetical protein [Streptomyces sp. TLI_171]|uniref:hypothetical protein n=1 Tax=Streptomyces sp. TLI_171 TaxID=1938859 RepID=UPI000C19B13D|nr:hypothetical protein [Streptomyces sp. TLI_171]RKE22498.1 hypothetical protein BX266_5942 [Streptomyces sp. TLI_171]
MRRLVLLLTIPVLALGALGAAAAPSDADLGMVRLDPDPVAAGGVTTVHALVENGGPERTGSAFTVLVELPVGFTAEGPFFPSSCSASATGRVVSCTFPAGLPAQRSATALVPVRADAGLPHGRTAVGQVRVVSVDDRNPVNDRTPFTLSIS